VRKRSIHALKQLVGKVLTGIVIAESRNEHPRSQIFLTFSDGSAFEFWSDGGSICAACGLDHQSLDDIVAVQESRDDAKVTVFRPRHNDPDSLQEELFGE